MYCHFLCSALDPYRLAPQNSPVFLFLQGVPPAPDRQYVSVVSKGWVGKHCSFAFDYFMFGDQLGKGQRIGMFIHVQS